MAATALNSSGTVSDSIGKQPVLPAYFHIQLREIRVLCEIRVDFTGFITQKEKGELLLSRGQQQQREKVGKNSV